MARIVGRMAYYAAAAPLVIAAALVGAVFAASFAAAVWFSQAYLFVTDWLHDALMPRR